MWLGSRYTMDSTLCAQSRSFPTKTYDQIFEVNRVNNIYFIEDIWHTQKKFFPLVFLSKGGYNRSVLLFGNTKAIF